MLRGRGQQCGALDGLLVDVRAGRSRVLVVRGEPGIGKTALLDYAIQSASGFRVARAAGVESELAGQPELLIEGLGNGDARALLGSALRVPLDERVRDRIVAETRGNPLALLELPRGLTPAQLAGGFGVLDMPGLPGRIEDRFRQRDAALPAASRRLLLVAAGPLDEFERAQADLLRGQITFASRRGSDAPPMLLKAARQFEPLDVRLARDTYLEALSAALFAGRLALGGGVLEVAHAARSAPRSPQPARAPDLLLDGLAVLITDGYPAGVPLLKQAVSAFRGEDISMLEEVRWLWVACHAAIVVWDHETWHTLSARPDRRGPYARRRLAPARTIRPGWRLRVYEIPSLHPSTLSGARAVLGVSSAMPAVLVTTIVLGMLAFPYVVSSQPSVSSMPDKRVIVVPLARAACLCQNPSA